MGKILNVQLGVEEFSHAPRQTMTPDTHSHQECPHGQDVVHICLITFGIPTDCSGYLLVI